MNNRRKPQSKNELKQDVESHPERGKVNGEDIIRFDRVEVRVKVPRELYRKALSIGGPMGLSKTEIITLALVKLVSDSGLQGVEEGFLEYQCEKHQITKKEARSKIFGAYKAVGRAKKLHLAQAVDDIEDEESE